MGESLQNRGATESNCRRSQGPLTEAVLLGSVCVRLEGQKLYWTPRI